MSGGGTRVVLVDDQAMVRAGLQMVLEAEPDLVVVGEAADGAAALGVVARSRPDVVLLDLRMPVMDGLETARRLLAADDPPRVLVLTTFDDDADVAAALRAGVSGFLLKTAPAEDLVAAVRTVAAGAGLLDPAVTLRVIASFASSAAPSAALVQQLGGLTVRETDVLRLVAGGMTNAEVAVRLHLGEATVKTHVSRVLLKLGLRDRVQAVAFAYESGLVVPGRGQRSG